MAAVPVRGGAGGALRPRRRLRGDRQPDRRAAAAAAADRDGFPRRARGGAGGDPAPAALAGGEGWWRRRPGPVRGRFLQRREAGARRRDRRPRGGALALRFGIGGGQRRACRDAHGQPHRRGGGQARRDGDARRRKPAADRHADAQRRRRRDSSRADGTRQRTGLRAHPRQRRFRRHGHGQGIAEIGGRGALRRQLRADAGERRRHAGDARRQGRSRRAGAARLCGPSERTADHRDRRRRRA